jgi:hypothetical protein
MPGWRLFSLALAGWVSIRRLIGPWGRGHIRVAIGRDYGNVPSTVGAMKGQMETQLQVRVRVTPSQALLPPDEEFAADQEWCQFLDETQELQLVTAQQ